MKAYCVECGGRVPVRVVILPAGGQTEEIQHCQKHPGAKRYRESFAASWFNRMREAVKPSRAVRGSVRKEVFG